MKQITVNTLFFHVFRIFTVFHGFLGDLEGFIGFLDVLGFFRAKKHYNTEKSYKLRF